MTTSLTKIRTTAPDVVTTDAPGTGDHDRLGRVAPRDLREMSWRRGDAREADSRPDTTAVQAGRCDLPRCDTRVITRVAL
jgi:hypothetical protein